MAWGLGYRICEYLLIKNDKFTKSFIIYFISMFISSWVGAKLLFLLVTRDVRNIALESNFWLGGGFVFLGGLLLSALVTWIFISKLKIISKEQLLVSVPAIALAHGVGRLGCFLAGCCFGVDTHGHFFEFERYPVQLFEAFGLFSLGVILFKRSKRNNFRFNGASYLLAYGSLRFALEFMRGDYIRGVYSYGLSTSQTISIFMILIGIIWYAKEIKRSL